MFKKFLMKRFSLALISLGFSILLFITAASANYSNKTNQVDKTTIETYTHTLEHVPIDIKYDKDKYFISGYSYDAEVYLTSTNRVKLDSEINSDTRTFKVVADLNHVTEGTTKVNLEVRDLPSDMTAKISPVNMTVTVGIKKTKRFRVDADVSSVKLGDGYELTSLSADVKEVEVTSDETTLNQIDHVVAKLSDDLTVTEDYTGEVPLQAVTASGTVLPSIIDPAKTKVKVKVTPIIKTVPIKVELTGKLPSGVHNVLYKLSSDRVVLQGKQELLDAIDAVTVHMDISDVTKEVTKMADVSENLPSGVTVLPEQMDIKLTPVK